MNFAEQVRGFAVRAETAQQEVFVNTAAAIHESIVEGSPVTGAPGQPVDTGALKASWHLEFVSPTEAQITTPMSYAPVIETGSRAAFDPAGQTPPKPPRGQGGHRHIKSTVGGPHSVELTRVGFSRIVEAETAKVAGGGA